MMISVLTEYKHGDAIIPMLIGMVAKAYTVREDVLKLAQPQEEKEGAEKRVL